MSKLTLLSITYGCLTRHLYHIYIKFYNFTFSILLLVLNCIEMSSVNIKHSRKKCNTEYILRNTEIQCRVTT